MKKVMIVCACVMMAIVLTSAKKKDSVMTKENGVYIVNTTELGKNVMGYESPTPLKVYIKDDKVQKIEFLDNTETPKYWKAASTHLQNKWDGMTVKAALDAQVDGRTGATFSSDAIKQNVKLALEYYKANK